MAGNPDCSELALTIYKIAMHHASQPGVDNIDKVTEIMQGSMPELDRQQVVDSLVEVAEANKRRLSEANKQMFKIRKEARTNKELDKAIAELQTAYNQNFLPPKKARTKPQRPAAIQKLMDTRDDLKSKLKTIDAAVKQRTERALKSEEAKIKKQIEKVQGHLDAETAPKRGMKQGANTKRIDALKTELKGLKEQLSKSHAVVQERYKAQTARRVADLEASLAKVQGQLDRNEAPTKGARKYGPQPEQVQNLIEKRDAALRALRNSPAAIRQKYEQTIADLKVELSEGEFAPPVAREDSPHEPEFRRLAFEAERLRRQVQAGIDSKKPRGFMRKYIGDPLNVFRNVMTGLDASAPGRQGNFVLKSNPKIAAKAIKPMIEAMRSPQREFEIHNEIMNDEMTPTLVKHGLFITDRNGPLSQQEEGFMTNLTGVVENIPGVAASSRGYSTFLNKLRLDYAKALVDTLSINGEPTAEDIATITNFVNNATGRGDLFGAEKASEVLNHTFFSPRYVTSRFKLVLAPFTGFKAFGDSKAARKAIAKEYVKYTAGTTAVHSLLGLAAIGLGGELKDFLMSLDPRSSDFLKIRFGNTTLDASGGIGQAANFLARIASGQTKTRSGDVKSIRGETKFGEDDASAYVGRFARGKLAPGPSAVMSSIAGTNVVGEPTNPMWEAVGLVAPLSLTETKSLIEEEGLIGGGALSALSALGFSTSTHKPAPKKSRLDKYRKE